MHYNSAEFYCLNIKCTTGHLMMIKWKQRNTEGDRVGPTRDNSPTYYYTLNKILIFQTYIYFIMAHKKL